jgi:hypothetical protein
MSEPRPVPKFASFRPKPTPPSPAPAPSTDQARREHRAKDDVQDRKDRKHHRKHRSRSRERHNQKQVEVKKRESPLREQAFFVVDKVGDEKNLIYGGTHKYSVPPFYRVGAGTVLGAPSSLKIDRDLSDDRKILLRDRRDFRSNVREKYVFSKVAKERPRLLKIRPELIEPSNVESDFVPFWSGRKRRRRNSSDSENGEVNYRSIHGKAKPRDEPMDEALEYATESESETERTLDLDTSIRQKAIDLSRDVEQSPNNIDAWIALIDHQDRLLRSGDDRRRTTNAEMQSTADIKIHMYEKALAKAITLHDRERLLLGLMKEGSKIWEIKSLSDRWDRISKENIDSLVLWKSYLDFRQTTFSTFRYEETRDVFLKRIKLLSETIRLGKDVESLYEQLLYVLLRLTVYIRESGYSELAVAVWQGLLEFNFFAPDFIASKEDKDKIAEFTEFWESEVPRVGEDGALGWSHYAHDKSDNPPEILADEEGDALENQEIFKSWTKAERLRSKTSCNPVSSFSFHQKKIVVEVEHKRCV